MLCKGLYMTTILALKKCQLQKQNKTNKQTKQNKNKNKTKKKQGDPQGDPGGCFAPLTSYPGAAPEPSIVTPFYSGSRLLYKIWNWNLFCRKI